MGRSRMVPLRAAQGPFHARVIAAHLGSEGVVSQVRGSDTLLMPPWHEVWVYVQEDDLDIAREILMVEEIESAFRPSRAASPAPRHRWLVIAAAALVPCTLLAPRLF